MKYILQKSSLAQTTKFLMAEREILLYEEFLSKAYVPRNVTKDPAIEKINFPITIDEMRAVNPWDYFSTFKRKVIDQHHDFLVRTGMLAKPEALEGRLLRRWLSLIREHHLFLLLRDRYKTVIRDPTVDLVWGIDALVFVGEHCFSIYAYVGTYRSLEFHEIKKKGHRGYHVGIPVELPLNPNTAQSIGNIWVYSEHDLKPLEDAINGKTTCQDQGH
jgi:hypothetical protein